MKFKLAVPEDVLNQHQINLIARKLSAGLLAVVVKNFPDWKARADAGQISGGEIICQKTDMTEPIEGLLPGVHLTLSLISYREERDFDGLGNDTIALVKQTTDQSGRFFMEGIKVFVQMSLDTLVVKSGTNLKYIASSDGRLLLEYIG